MTEVLACAQQPLLTYLLEVLIVDDAPSGCVIKKSNGRCHLMVKTTREEFQKIQRQMPSGALNELKLQQLARDSQREKEGAAIKNNK